MGEYIFFTAEGFTQGPNGDDVENCQLMGIASGLDAKEALLNLLEENPWIEEHCFDPRKFICKEFVPCKNA